MQAETIFPREARPEDAEALAALKLATFRETFLEDFAVPYPPADLAQFETDTYGLARIQAELADPAHRSWVVEDPRRPGELLAYAHIGPCKLPHPEVAPGELELYQIYLRRAVRGTGLGPKLFDVALAGMAALTEITARGRIWIGVWSGNQRAQAFYARRGFAVVGEYKFQVGDWFDDEFIMARDAAPAA